MILAGNLSFGKLVQYIHFNIIINYIFKGYNDIVAEHFSTIRMFCL